MAKYVDSEVVKDKLSRTLCLYKDLPVLIDSIPAADVRPVVRCADCKWFQNNMRQDGYLPEGVPEWECRHWCGPCDPTDFCSYGAKMGGEEE